MRPITIIVAALVAGAAARRKPAAKPAIKDAYARVKALIQDKYGIRTLEALELTPHSKNKQASVAAELTDAGVDKDEALLDQAKSPLKSGLSSLLKIANAEWLNRRSRST